MGGEGVRVFRDSRAQLAFSSRKPSDNGKREVLWSRTETRVFGRSLPWIDPEPASEHCHRVTLACHRRISLSSEVLAEMHPKTQLFKRVLFSRIFPCRKRIRGQLLGVPPSMAAWSVRLFLCKACKIMLYGKEVLCFIVLRRVRTHK